MEMRAQYKILFVTAVTEHRGKTFAHAWGTKKDGEEFKCQIVNNDV